jgi:DNA-binding IclR family transcriptional regulator
MDMRERIKQKIIGALSGANEPLTITKLAHRAKINRLTASDYVLKLQESGEITVTPKPPLKLITLRRASHERGKN